MAASAGCAAFAAAGSSHSVAAPVGACRRRSAACRGSSATSSVPILRYSTSIETADGQIEQRPGFVRLDVGREHPGRGLRGSAADRAIVDHRAGHAPYRELARDRAADDPGSNDNH